MTKEQTSKCKIFFTKLRENVAYHGNECDSVRSVRALFKLISSVSPQKKQGEGHLIRTTS